MEQDLLMTSSIYFEGASWRKAKKLRSTLHGLRWFEVLEQIWQIASVPQWIDPSLFLFSGYVTSLCIKRSFPSYVGHGFLSYETEVIRKEVGRMREFLPSFMRAFAWSCSSTDLDMVYRRWFLFLVRLWICFMLLVLVRSSAFSQIASWRRSLCFRCVLFSTAKPKE